MSTASFHSKQGCIVTSAIENESFDICEQTKMTLTMCYRLTWASPLDELI